MRVLVFHNLYQLPGGEDAVVREESALLRDAGHEVGVISVSNDAITGLSGKLRAFVNTPYDASRKDWMKEQIRLARADVVHIHNFFPLLTPAIHEAAAEMKVGVVQTLHNYRLLCANSTFLRKGNICEDCLSGTRAWGVVHRCYRGSLAGSLAVVRMQARAERSGVWHKHVHRFIALTEFSRSKFVEGGFPADRIVVKANFVADRHVIKGVDRAGALFVGRLSAEKGVDVMLEAWRKLDIPLTIVGDGPDRAQYEASAGSNVTFVGQLPPDKVRDLMLRSAFLLVPSVWYEGFPMTVVEAFSAGLPVLASRIGSLGEIIVDHQNGRLYQPGSPDDLAAVVGQVWGDGSLPRLGLTARAQYEKLYSPRANLPQLESIYDGAIEAATN